MAKSITLLQEVGRDNALRHLLCSDEINALEFKEGDYLQAEIKVIRGAKNKRNALMNRCIHKYCSILANLLNSRGLDMAIFFAKYKEGEPVKWEMEDVKNRIFKPTLMGIAGTDKTSGASNMELCQVDEALGKFFSEREDIQITWPNNEPPAWSNYE